MMRRSARNIDCDNFDMLLSVIRMALVNCHTLLLLLDGSVSLYSTQTASEYVMKNTIPFHGIAHPTPLMSAGMVFEFT